MYIDGRLDRRKKTNQEYHQPKLAYELAPSFLASSKTWQKPRNVNMFPLRRGEPCAAARIKVA
jgi:hypothetical protein